MWRLWFIPPWNCIAIIIYVRTNVNIHLDVDPFDVFIFLSFITFWNQNPHISSQIPLRFQNNEHTIMYYSHLICMSRKKLNVIFCCSLDIHFYIRNDTLLFSHLFLLFAFFYIQHGVHKVMNPLLFFLSCIILFTDN